MSSTQDAWPVLSPAEWRPLRDAHRERAEALLAGVRERRRTGRRHPVEDFLFDYYTLRPRDIAAWHPGVGRRLAGAEDDFAGAAHHLVRDGLVVVDVVGVGRRRSNTLAWIKRLLTAEQGRKPFHGCFGMHEWAMVYGLKPEETRHPGLPLRFGPDRIREVVDEVGLRCTHFDAFRFFTPEAAPHNATWLTRQTQAEHDQPGCLHALMDLYKWAGKLLPLTPPELLLDTFELARDIREVDMRASAYDLAAWGYAPIRVETPEGRREYAALQRGFGDRSADLRVRILRLVDEVCDALDAEPARQ